MLVIPAINCVDVECAKEKIIAALEFLPEDGWIHIDVADASFTFNKTWGSPNELKDLLAQGMTFKPEIHLMVAEPEKVVPAWLGAGVKRIIVHAETMQDPSVFDSMLNLCANHNAQLMLAISPETPAESIAYYFGKVSAYGVLAVNPGIAGQKFLPLVLGKIRYLRSQDPQASIEVDGGINEETAKMAKDAGADLVVSASYIFESPDPALAYSMLLKID